MMRRDKYITFSLSGRRYGLSLACVKEVTTFAEVTRLPNVPRYFVGLMNLRGQVITVIDMAVKFGIGAAVFRPQRTCVIISTIGNKHFGFLVDEVFDVTAYGTAELSALKDKTGHGIGHPGVHLIARDSDESITPLIDLDSAFELSDFELFTESLQSAI